MYDVITLLYVRTYVGTYVRIYMERGKHTLYHHSYNVYQVSHRDMVTQDIGVARAWVASLYA